MTEEEKRLAETRSGRGKWRRWGPYVSERQWGTVREDYSPHGDAWEYLTHDAARSRAFRWGEEGIAGICDDGQRLVFAVALWNGNDPILKERLFGLNGKEGNHGEDVKELYYYLDNTPTHSYQKMLYKYPQAAFPYSRLLAENRRRGRHDPEFELLDTGIFDDDRYFDVVVEYAKAAPEDILIRITAHNRGPEPAALHVLPTIWFRNTWAWGGDPYKPRLVRAAPGAVGVMHRELAAVTRLHCDSPAELLFCENETNARRLFGAEAQGYCKDGINDYVVNGAGGAVNPAAVGTKAAAHCRLTIPARASSTIRLRLGGAAAAPPFERFDDLFAQRRGEADAFYDAIQSAFDDDDARLVQRQAFAGMLWSKQFYCYDVRRWLDGDPAQPPPPPERRHGRNSGWTHLNNADVISMPDKWEYPWYAAWDLAFHAIPLAMIDAEFAKEQLILLTREWYMHPNGQLPAYEWGFDKINPPVHAWAAWRVYKIDEKRRGRGDLEFLERVFHKLLLNFTWWVNREDAGGHNIFQGGFLGLDNIGVFDRSAMLPAGEQIEQADATSWMAMYSLNMMRIALELARTRHLYEDLATKFFEHFLYIAGAMADVGGRGIDLWDGEDEFFYDVLSTPRGMIPLRMRSMVGIIPLFAVEVLEPGLMDSVPAFKRRLEWFCDSRPDLAALISRWREPGRGDRRLLSLLRGHRMKRILARMLDETEFLSGHGVRSLSRQYADRPYEVRVDGRVLTVDYQPAESDSDIFGGNSNWRGPVWFPANFLIIESLQRFHHYYGDDFRIECPSRSGTFITIGAAAEELRRRLCTIFLRDASSGRRPVFGDHPKLQNDPHFRDLILFHECFHGDNGSGVGASHQTGWTGLVAKLLQPRSAGKMNGTAPGSRRPETEVRA